MRERWISVGLGVVLLGVLIIVFLGPQMGLFTVAQSPSGGVVLQQPSPTSPAFSSANVASTATSLAATLSSPGEARAALVQQPLPTELPDGGGGGGQQPPAPPPQPVQRVIIRNAVMSIVVEDPSTRADEIVTMANEMGGWLVESSTSVFTQRGEEYTRATVTVRVPAERLDEALEMIRAGAESVASENITGQDVTQDFVDTSSRLANLEAAELQLQAVLEDARSVEDVLGVYRELVRLRGEIEVARGRLQYFSEASAFSSVAVTLNPVLLGPVVETVTGWQPSATVDDAVSSLIGMGQGVVDFLIFAAIVWLPVLLILAVPGWFVFRLAKRRFQLWRADETVE